MVKVKLNYKSLGLRVGLEFHQMLDTREKLFCNCPPNLMPADADADYLFKRRLRPTTSELGEVDPAALFEFKRGRVYEYHHFDNASCLVEMDEEPPHDLNYEALRIVLTVALMLNSQPVDEVYVMRKTVIDGSNTTGFQRTALVALGGSMEVDGKKIPIQTICLEEDAARKVSEDATKVTYRLDRLGVPLIEIATAPVISSPEEAEKVALKIGQLLRLTKKVKRGIGTIRQDINISIKGGAKIEIKGVQKLGLIRKVVEYEVLRQYNLLNIRDMLRERGVVKEHLKRDFVDVTDIFEGTKCRVIRRALKKGGCVLAVKLSRFKGILGYEIQPGRRFATELADRARFWGGVGGIFHSDELPAYGISEEEVRKVSERLNLGEKDAFVLIADERSKVIEALNAVIDRCIEALEGVPEETRGPNPDGTTHYSRPRPGAARMYPETDIRPRRITEEFLNEIKRQLPEPLDVKLQKFVKDYGLSKNLAEQMISSYYLDSFERLVEKYPNVPPRVIAATFENTLKSLRREGVPVDELEDEVFDSLFSLLNEGEIVKEAIPKIIEYLARNPSKTVLEAVEELNLKALERDELEKIVTEVFEEKKEAIMKLRERALGMLMGEVMRRVSGRADGSLVNQVIRERLRVFLSRYDD
ncbi:MAG: Glu-tRNA(Gln) amidotransferase GatDE subunit E [Thermoprotei archaeon]|nr:MAG: Glu-tRNA(Gln) amidotransferase GatDE subunit E [Thermoprotei archaeon]RLF03614.1 MAG: Glu-tRNA(Gln) amidotransferase GatDE subunit E [Thermoprotei archaeon]